MFKVSKDKLVCLVSWVAFKFDKKLKKQVIKEDEFLTFSTAEWLSVTIQFFIDLVAYLLNQCGFDYVFTAKINQDCFDVKTEYYFHIKFKLN